MIYESGSVRGRDANILINPSPDPLSAPETNDADLLSEQLKLVGSQLMFAVSGNVAAGGASIYLLWGLVSPVILTGWLLLLLSSMAFKIRLALSCRNDCGSIENLSFIKRQFILSALSTGLLWGAAGVLFELYIAAQYHAFIAFLLGGLAAGSIATNAAVYPVFLAFILPMLVPLNLAFYLSAQQGHLLLGILTTFFIAAMAALGKNYQNVLNRAIALRFKNEKMIDVLTSKEERMELIASSFADGLVVLNPAYGVEYMNPAARQLLGWEMEEVGGVNFHDLLHAREEKPCDIKTCGITRAMERLDTIRRDGEQFCNKAGVLLPVAYTAVPFRNSVREVGLLLTFQDITARLKKERELREAEQRFYDVTMSSSDWVWEVDTQGRYTYASARVKEVLGYAPEELLGKTPFELMEEETANEVRAFFEDVVRHQKPIKDLKNWNLSKEGRKVCLLTNGVPLYDAAGGFTGYRGVDRDITEEEELTKLAAHDELTGLLNRRQLEQTLLREIEQAKNKPHELSVLMLDIDYFKEINDTYGHYAGDEALRQLSRIIGKNIRSSDHAARYGGEEFVIILPHTGHDGAVSVAEEIRSRVADTTFRLNGQTISITVSIGVSTLDTQTGIVTKDTLLLHADKALYQAKHEGRNRVCSVAADGIDNTFMI